MPTCTDLKNMLNEKKQVAKRLNHFISYKVLYKLKITILFRDSYVSLQIKHLT